MIDVDDVDSAEVVVDAVADPMIVDLADGDLEREVSETGTLLTSWLPTRRVRRVEPRRLDFGTARQ